MDVPQNGQPVSVETAKERLRLLGEVEDSRRKSAAVPLLVAAGAGLLASRAVTARGPRRGPSPLGRLLSTAFVLRVARVATPIVIRALARRAAAVAP